FSRPICLISAEILAATVDCRAGTTVPMALDSRAIGPFSALAAFTLTTTSSLLSGATVADRRDQTIYVMRRRRTTTTVPINAIFFAGLDEGGGGSVTCVPS